jgi:hypothetical protein
MSEYEPEDEEVTDVEVRSAHERLDLLASNVEDRLGLLQARLGALEAQVAAVDSRLSLFEETLREHEIDLPT